MERYTSLSLSSPSFQTALYCFSPSVLHFSLLCAVHATRPLLLSLSLSSVTIHPFFSPISLPFLSFILSLFHSPESDSRRLLHSQTESLSSNFSLSVCRLPSLSLALPPVHSLSYSLPLILLHPSFFSAMSFPEWM